MPIIPFAAAIGGALGTSAAVGGTLLAGATVAGGLAVSQAVAQAKQAKALKAGQAPTTVTPDASQIVGDKTANTTANAENNGRAALISTSPTGVQGLDPTQRRSLLGN